MRAKLSRRSPRLFLLPLPFRRPQYDIISQKLHPAGAETVSATLQRLDPRHLKRPMRLAQQAPAHQHQRLRAVGQAERQDLTLGPPPLRAAIGDPDAELVPAGFAQQIEVDRVRSVRLGRTPRSLDPRLVSRSGERMGDAK